MIDIRGQANMVSSTINGNVPVVVKKSSGYTVDTNTLRQVPTYTDTAGFAQVQALSAADLKQLDSLNIQGVMRAIYFRGALAGVVRPDQTGGDLVEIDDAFVDRVGGKTWLVRQVLESWPTWSKAAIVLQGQ